MKPGEDENGDYTTEIYYTYDVDEQPDTDSSIDLGEVVMPARTWSEARERFVYNHYDWWGYEDKWGEVGLPAVLLYSGTNMIPSLTFWAFVMYIGCLRFLLWITVEAGIHQLERATELSSGEITKDPSKYSPLSLLTSPVLLVASVAALLATLLGVVVA